MINTLFSKQLQISELSQDGIVTAGKFYAQAVFWGALQPCQGSRQERRWFLLPLLADESKKGMVAQDLPPLLLRDSLVLTRYSVFALSCSSLSSFHTPFISVSSMRECLIPDSWSLRVQLLHCKI